MRPRGFIRSIQNSRNHLAITEGFSIPLSFSLPPLQKLSPLNFTPSRFLSQSKSANAQSRQDLEFHKKLAEQAQIQEMRARIKKWNSWQENMAERVDFADISLGAINKEAARFFAIVTNVIREELNGKTIQQLRTAAPNTGPQAGTGEGGWDYRVNDTLEQRTMGQKGTAAWGFTAKQVAFMHRLVRKDGQSAKSGLGGALAGAKVTPFIAGLRGVLPWLSLYSPANHADRSIEDIDMDWHGLASLNPFAAEWDKLVATPGVRNIAIGSLLSMGPSEIGNAEPGLIIAAQGGGTGNAPKLPLEHGAFPLWYQLYQTHKLLTEAGYRNQMRLYADGKISDALSLVMAILFGADGVRIGTLGMIALGCIKADICYGNKCPVYLATNDEEKVALYKGSILELFNVFEALITSAAEILSAHFPNFESAIGRTDMLKIIDPGFTQSLPPIPKKAYPQTPLKPKIGSSKRENQVIEEIKQGKKSFKVPADNLDLSWSARTAHFYYTSSSFQQQVQAGIKIQLEGLAPGQGLGYGGPPHVTLTANHCNDNVAKHGSGVRVYAKTMGHHAGAYMNGPEGGIVAKGVSSRHCFLARDGFSLTQVAGPYAFNYVVGGFHVYTGYPQHSPGVKLEGPYSPPFALKPYATDVCAFEYFQGGEVIIAKSLWDEGVALGHIGKTPQAQLSHQALTSKDKQSLISIFKDFVTHIEPCSLILAFLKQQDLWDKWFIKLTPPKPQPPEHILKQQSPQKIQSSSINNSLAEAQELLKAAAEQKLSPILAPGNPTGVLDPNREKAACGIGLIIGESSYDILAAGREMLRRTAHRGVRFDEKIGGGCGIMIGGGEKFWSKQFKQELMADNYSVWPILMPRDEGSFQKARSLLIASLQKKNLKISGERVVPVHEEFLSEKQVRNRRRFMQYLVVKDEVMPLEEFDRSLIFCGLHFEMQVQQEAIRSHVFSFLRGIVIYKTRGIEELVGSIFPDLTDQDFQPYMVLTHVRKPTNVLSIDKNLAEGQETEMTGEESTQPIHGFASNGENNAVGSVHNSRRDPRFSQALDIDLSKIDPTQSSDAANAAFFAGVLQLYGLSPQQIHRVVFPELDPLNNNPGSLYNKLYGMPAEGPNFSLAVLGLGNKRKIIAGADPLGQRPGRGAKFVGRDPITGIEKSYFILGSEHGIIPEIGGLKLMPQTDKNQGAGLYPEGGLIELTAGEALIIDEKNGSFEMMKHTSEEQKQYAARMKTVAVINPCKEYKQSPLEYSAEELSWRQALAGINPESTQAFLTMLYHDGAGDVVAMGSDGPEPDRTLYRKKLSDTIRTLFAQVTNVPVSFTEYGAMCSLLHVGPEPELSELGGDKPCQGHLIEGPLVDNHQMSVLMNSEQLKTVIIDTVYTLGDRPSVIQLTQAIKEVCRQVLSAAKQGATLVVLSDKKIQWGKPAIDPMLLAGIVSKMLSEEGFGRQVSLAVQSAEAFLPIYHIALLALGVKVINPYLIFTPDAACQADPQRFAKERLSYCKQANLQIMKYGLGVRGFLTAKGYCGARQIATTGLNPEIAKEMGIWGEPGTMSYIDMLLEDIRVHQRKEIGPSGFYGGRLEESIWSPLTVQLYHGLMRAKTPEERASWRAKIDKNAREKIAPGQTYGSFKLVQPTRWTPQHPLTFAIVGAGPAGIKLANFLLERFPLPNGNDIQILFYEANPANIGGHGQDGVAPDSPVTKAIIQTEFEKILLDKRIRYIGGVEVVLKHDSDSKRPSFEQLQKDYPGRVFDASGVRERNLSEFESSEIPVIYASELYRNYNGAYPSLHHKKISFEEKLINNRSDEVLIIGAGNVAADISRMLAKNLRKLTQWAINPLFVSLIERSGIKRVVVVARKSHPLELKISGAELQAYVDSGIELLATFDDMIEDKPLGEEEKRKLSILREAQRRRQQKEAEPFRTVEEVKPCVHFILGYQVYKGEKQEEGVDIIFTGKNKPDLVLKPKAVVIAVGIQEPAPNPFARSIGWRAGEGGDLSIIEKNVGGVFSDIFLKILAGDFDQITPEPENYRAPDATLSNQDQLNLLRYNKEQRKGKPWTPAMIAEARHYKPAAPVIKSEAPRSVIESVVVEKIPSKAEIAKGQVIVKQGRVGKEDKILISDYKGQTLFSAHSKVAAANNANRIPGKCEGLCTCGNCVVIVPKTVSKSLGEPTKKEQALLSAWKAANNDPCGPNEDLRISCLHELEKFDGVALIIPSEGEGEPSPSLQF